MRYGFVIDLKRCYGCYSCQVSCKAENLTPPGVFLARCLKGETGKYPTVVRQSLPVLCMQCKDPECKKVCPTKATTVREDGIVTIDKNLCIGCKYCIVACPYGARYFVPKWKSYFPDKELPNPLKREENPFEAYSRKRWIEEHGEGTVAKCDFCIERVEKGLNPACVDACPAKARYFGNLEDPETEVSILIKTERGFQLNPEFGTDPAVYYLPPR
ncbi:MAG: 4Fe-4S dicluster domain-containing protein [Acidobacteriota bacterium]